MERNANYALVGLSTLILTVALVVFVVWLARVRINAEYDLYDIVFQGPVRGLNEGGEVHFNGIKVGEVSKIALDKFNPRNVIARVRVTEDVPIRVDSYATLEPQGITGLNYVQITAGTGTRQLLKEADKPRCERLGLGRDCIPVIRSQRSAISDLAGRRRDRADPHHRGAGPRQPRALRPEHKDVLRLAVGRPGVHGRVA